MAERATIVSIRALWYRKRYADGPPSLTTTAVSTLRAQLATLLLGVDTHRFWEALRHGAVPVVITSALDSVYELFPVSARQASQ